MSPLHYIPEVLHNITDKIKTQGIALYNAAF